MKQVQPHSYMTRFRLWWEALDTVLVGRGLKPLSYERARQLFDCEIEAADVPAFLGFREARSDVDDDFATRVKSLLARPELTQAKLAKLLGVTQSTISKWTRGEDPRHAHERRLHMLERSLGGPQ